MINTSWGPCVHYIYWIEIRFVWEQRWSLNLFFAYHSSWLLQNCPIRNKLMARSVAKQMRKSFHLASKQGLILRLKASPMDSSRIRTKTLSITSRRNWVPVQATQVISCVLCTCRDAKTTWQSHGCHAKKFAGNLFANAARKWLFTD